MENNTKQIKNNNQEVNNQEVNEVEEILEDEIVSVKKVAKGPKAGKKNLKSKTDQVLSIDTINSLQNENKNISKVLVKNAKLLNGVSEVETELESEKTSGTRTGAKLRTVYSIDDYTDLLSYLEELKPHYENYDCKSSLEAVIDVLEKRETNATFFAEMQKLAEERKTCYQSLIFTTSETDIKREGYIKEDRKNFFSLQNLFILLNKDILTKNGYIQQKLQLTKVPENDKFILVNGIHVIKIENIHLDASEFKELIQNISYTVIKKINSYNYLAYLLHFVMLHILSGYSASDLKNNPCLKQQKDRIVTMFANEGIIKRVTKVTEKKPLKPISSVHVDVTNLDFGDMESQVIN